MSQRGRLRHLVKKGKISIIEGTGGLIFCYQIDPIKLYCQCSSGKPVCDHLKYYLSDIMGIKPEYLPILSVPRVRSVIPEIWGDGPISLSDYCYEFLTNEAKEQCIICHDPYLMLKNHRMDTISALYQCPRCFELYHNDCYSKWKNTGSGGCPRCRYKRELGGMHNDSDVQWPTQASV